MKRDIVAVLKQDPNWVCTTMFDYYTPPQDRPGVRDAKKKGPMEGVLHVETELGKTLADAMGTSFNPNRFLPYVQLHEFQALLFSEPTSLAAVLPTVGLASELEQIVEECGEPELINDDPAGAPSKRIDRLSKGYQKVLHGYLAAARIGVPRMLSAARISPGGASCQLDASGCSVVL